MQFPLKMYIYYLLLAGAHLSKFEFETACQTYRQGERLDVLDLEGTWITVFIQPSTVNCFILLIRPTTELERDQCFLKYGNFGGRVDWNKCLLEIESPLGKHYLQGTGNRSGLLENIIITETRKGEYELHEQNANQWSLFGRRGSELLLMTDCRGGALVLFARAPYWPVADEFYTALRRSGVRASAVGQVLCEPLDRDAQQALHHYYSQTNAERINNKKISS